MLIDVKTLINLLGAPYRRLLRLSVRPSVGIAALPRHSVFNILEWDEFRCLEKFWISMDFLYSKDHIRGSSGLFASDHLSVGKKTSTKGQQHVTQNCRHILPTRS